MHAGFSKRCGERQESGIAFSPGSAGLYNNGVRVGGLGVGVDQDGFVTSAGTAGFEAPTAIRADQIFIDGVLLGISNSRATPRTEPDQEIFRRRLKSDCLSISHDFRRKIQLRSLAEQNVTLSRTFHRIYVHLARTSPF